MKKVGIIFPMKEELDAIRKYLTINKETKIYELTFIEGIINNTPCILVECGVGKVNAARTTQILIDKYSPDYILNVGVAGGIDKSLHVLDIVIGNKLIQHDFDITAFNHNKGYIPNIGDYIEVSSKLVDLAIKSSTTKNIKVGTIASGDIFCTDEKLTTQINQQFAALCVEMEGAAIAQVATLCNIPFLILRSISDVPNNNNVLTYEEFLIESTKIIAEVTFNLLGKLNELD